VFENKDWFLHPPDQSVSDDVTDTETRDAALGRWSNIKPGPGIQKSRYVKPKIPLRDVQEDCVVAVVFASSRSEQVHWSCREKNRAALKDSIGRVIVPSTTPAPQTKLPIRHCSFR